MATHRARDLDQTREQLQRWLEAQLTKASELRVSELTPPGATGFSNDTLFFDLSFQRDGREQRHELVLRVAPSGFQIFPEYDLSRQVRMMQRLQGSGVPVPEILWHEEDPGVLGAAFYVMARVEGRIPTDNPPYHQGGWITELTPQERGELWRNGLEVLARIHQLDWRSLGLEFLPAGDAEHSPTAAELERYARFLRWAMGDKPHPTCDAALTWLRERLPDEEPTAISWGDARLGNMIFQDGRCAAVLDWEMAQLGSPEADLAWWLFVDRHHSEGLEVPRLEGFPSPEETIAQYEKWTGHAVRYLDYYEVFAGFRFSVVMARVAQQLVAYELLPPDSDFETNNICTRLLARTLGLSAP